MQRRYRVLVTVVLMSLMSFGLALNAKINPKLSSPSAPVAFERNVGQARYEGGKQPYGVDAVLRLGSTTAYIHGTGLDILQQVTYRVANRDPYMMEYEVDLFRTDMRLIGSNPDPRIEFSGRQPGTMRYINAHTGIDGIAADRFGSIVYHDVWPGIDMRLYLTSLGLKYDFVVRPGADPRMIAFRYEGTTAPVTDEDGNLVVETPLGSLGEQAPVVFTTDDNGMNRIPVKARYQISGSSVRFKLAAYDPTRLLVVDPQRVWATYYGGNNTIESAYSAIDPTGNIIIAGSTIATNMPSSPGVLQRRLKAQTDGYVAKFDERGQFLWHTYYGGSLIDKLNDVTTDAKGNIWACGQSNSKDRPEFSNALIGSAPYGDPDSIQLAEAMVLMLQPDGKWGDSWEVYGRENDVATGIAVTATRVAIVGHTRSPRLGGLFGEAPYRKDTTNFNDNTDLFLSIVKPRTSTPNKWTNDYLIFYGGGDFEYGGKIAFDKQGNVIFSGTTESNNFPVTDGSRFKGIYDVGVVKFGTTPTRQWASVFGSASFETLGDLAIDSKGDVVIVGTAEAGDFPVSNAIKATLAGPSDGFVRKYTSAGAVAWSTYYGGDSADALRGVAIDQADNIWVAGSTGRSPNIPLTPDALQATPFALSGTDGIMGKLNPTGQTLLYGSFLGAPPQTNLPTPPPPPPPPPPAVPPNVDFGNDELFDVALDNNAYVVFTGIAQSYRMTTTPGAYQDSSKLDKDTLRKNAFLAYFTQCKDSIIQIQPNGPATICDVDSRQLIGPKGFARYLWSTGETTANIIVRDSGSYTVLCTTTDGCRYRDTIFIGRNPKPSVSAGRDTSLCIKSSIPLRATPSGGTAPYTFKWNRVETGVEFIDDDTLQTVNVNPGTTSRYEVTVTDGSGCTARDTVLVTVIDPKPGVTPSSVDFGTIDACASSAEIDITISNPHSYELRATGFVPDDPRISMLTSLTPGVVIAPNASVTLRVRIAASTAGTISGTFNVTGTPCGWSALYRYTAKKDQLTASITPGVVSFGAGVVCQTTVRLDTAVIRNSGKVDLVVKPAAVSAPFALVSPSADVTLKPGETRDVVFSYTPTAGTHSSDIVFPFESGACKDSLRVKLNAVTSAVTASVTPASINGGTLSGCENQRDTAITIANTSDVPITVTLPSDPEIVYTPAGPLTIAARSSATVDVSLRPGTAGAFSRTQELQVEPCAVKVSVSYSLQKNGIAFTTPSVVNFGEFSSCDPGTSKQQSTSLSFDGTGSASIKSVIVGGPRITTSLTQGLVLSAGQAQQFTVTWTPVADGPLVDSIVVVFDPCDVRRVIRLQGVRTSVALRAENPTVDLGTITNSASGRVRFTNTGTDTITVGVSSMSSTTQIDKAVPGSLEPLLPGAELVADFTTFCKGRTSVLDTIQATVVLPCFGQQLKTIITGTCTVSNVVTSTVSIDSVSAKTGEQFIVPVRLTRSQGLEAAAAKSWRATLTYDPAVIVGRANTTDCWLPNTPGPCSITIQGTRGADTVGTLFALNFTAVLGSIDRTALTLTDFQWIGVNAAVIERRDGAVTISNICREGGDRYLIPKKNGFGIVVYPTPASSDITMDVKGLGSDALAWTLTNMLGEVLQSGTELAEAGGDLRRTLDVSAFGAGTYTMTVNARGVVTTIPVLIQR